MIYRIPFVVAVIIALTVVWLGVNGTSYTAGCATAFCNSVRSLEWETLTAGLFGLAGGLAVIWATQTQIASQRKAAVDLELIDIDSFIKELEARFDEIVKTVNKLSPTVMAEDPVSAGRTNVAIDAVTKKVETNLLYKIDSNQRFPASLRISARAAHDQTVLAKMYRFGVTKGKMHYTKISSTQQGLDKWAQDSHQQIEDLKMEREKYSKFLMNR